MTNTTKMEARAAEILAAAAAAPAAIETEVTGRKVWIEEAFLAARRAGRATTRPAFQAELVALHRAGLVVLARADLRSDDAEWIDDCEMSETELTVGGEVLEVFHFITLR